MFQRDITSFLQIQCNTDESLKLDQLVNWLKDQFSYCLESFSGEHSHNFGYAELRDMQASIAHFSEETGLTFKSAPKLVYDSTSGHGSGYSDDWQDRTTDLRIWREENHYDGGFTGGYEFD